MNSSVYITFSALDYRGYNTLSSFSLDITPLKFVPDIPNLTEYNIIWDFGDGTISKSFSASKVYNFPGEYKVSMIVYDCDSNALISNENKLIQIHDYYTLTFKINYLAYLINESGFFVLDDYGNYVTVDGVTIGAYNGEILGPFRLNSFYPWYQKALNIYYDVRNGNCKNYWDIDSNKYSHLENYNCLYESTYNYAISAYQYYEIEKITPNVSPIYLKLQNGEIVRTFENDEGSCFAGISGSYAFYIKNDAVTDNLLIDFKFDSTNYTNPYFEKFNYVNNLGITLSATISSNIPTKLSVSSNGLDGEGVVIHSFDIEPIKFSNTAIPFVVKIKDADHFDVKNFDYIQLSALSISLSATGNPTIQYTISSLNYTLSSQNYNGAFRGFIKFYNVTTPLSNIKINVSGTFENDQSISYALTGESNTFNVYPLEYYDLYKINEDFDSAQTLKDITFQETILQNDVLYNDFFGAILGYNDLEHEDIGVKIYEKISNFVSNTQDIETCNIESINSIGQLTNYIDIFEERYSYPEKIKRLVDLLSISKLKLTGYENKFDQNFDIRGNVSKETYGRNIGSQIDTKTYVITASVPIVGLEKFSNNYVLLNTYQPVSAVNNFIYPLSTYNSNWGWPLVLPTTFNFSDIEKYYLFFEYVEDYDNTIIGGVVDFENQKTNIPFDTATSELNSEYGIVRHLLMDTLYQSLSLIV